MCPPYMISPNRYLRSSHGTLSIATTSGGKNIIMVLCPIPFVHDTNGTSHLCICFQVVVEYVNRYCQVSGVEGVLSVPTLGSKLSPLCHTGMEVTQREEDGLELLFTTTLFQDVLHRKKKVNN